MRHCRTASLNDKQVNQAAKENPLVKADPASQLYAMLAALCQLADGRRLDIPPARFFLAGGSHVSFKRLSMEAKRGLVKLLGIEVLRDSKTPSSRNIP